jgi:hypothetical protein
VSAPIALHFEPRKDGLGQLVDRIRSFCTVRLSDTATLKFKVGVGKNGINKASVTFTYRW